MSDIQEHEKEKVDVLIKGHGPKNQDPEAGAHYQATIVNRHEGITTTIQGPVDGAQTAHRAAQEAVIHSLKEVRDTLGKPDESCEQLDIKTRDRFVADGMGELGKKWKENGYKDSSGKALTHADNFMKMHELRDELEQRGWKVTVTHHSRSQVSGTLGEKHVESTGGQPASEEGGAGLPNRKRSDTVTAADAQLGQDAGQNRETVGNATDAQPGQDAEQNRDTVKNTADNAGSGN
ncbi:MAG: hypothetical protein Q9187_001328 [Circinaria calcarea]